jgi:hypothetical protein
MCIRKYKYRLGLNARARAHPFIHAYTSFRLHVLGQMAQHHMKHMHIYIQTYMHTHAFRLNTWGQEAYQYLYTPFSSLASSTTKTCNSRWVDSACVSVCVYACASVYFVCMRTWDAYIHVYMLFSSLASSTAKPCSWRLVYLACVCVCVDCVCMCV